MDRRTSTLIVLGLTAIVTGLVMVAMLRGNISVKRIGVRVQAGPSESQSSLQPPKQSAIFQRQSSGSPTQSFIDSQKASQGSREAALQRRGLDGEREALRAIFRQSKIAPPYPKRGMTSGEVKLLSTLFEDEVVNLLESLDFSPRKILSYQSQGLDPVSAAAAFIRGMATPSQTAILADLTVIGTVAGSVDSQIGDGYNSTTTVAISSKLAGRDNGNTATIRQRSGKSASGLITSVSGDLASDIGITMVIMMSRNWYKQSVVEGTVRRKESVANEDPNARIILGQPYYINGDSIIPAHNYGASGSLSELKNTALKLEKVI